ncbi:MAG TPA: metal ABC transporter permease [Fimbriimonadaceae bacterium]|nr:metal ABC transporter permease [Fimbriimonadaceae bacterium]HRJ32624.1 metal ABC transporter permease [Fimbriimonadaceae bacterium]
MSPAATWSLVIALLAAGICSALGVWLVLLRQSLTGDGISHSVLPGLVLVFLLFGTRANLAMMLGAAVAGLLTVWLSREISRLTRIREDASLGVVFTIFFAIGVILITRSARQIDLDPGCVLYGLVEFVGFDTIAWAGYDVPRTLPILVITGVIVAAFLTLFHKELALMAFDPSLAHALRRHPHRLYLALMAMVALTTVACFEAVGSILVIALLIAPAATAQLLTRRFAPMMIGALVGGASAAVAGYFLAVRWNTSIAGMIASVLGAQYLLAVILISLLQRSRRSISARGASDPVLGGSV